jgi:2,4-dienoyl-CoA reductase-like NADH-dependent reductase (Old Yellow Enzyme family)
MTQYTNLFQPVQLRHKTLRNRIIFGAHTANMFEREIEEIIEAFTRAAFSALCVSRGSKDRPQYLNLDY